MGRTRRSIIRGAGAATIAVTAGCSGSGDGGGIAGGLSVDSVDSQVTAFGNVVLTVTVSNDSDSSKSKTLMGQVDVSGGDTYTKRRDITVSGSSSNTFELEFDIAASESLSADRYEYTAELEG